MSTRFAGYDTYAEYLRSPHWLDLRKKHCGPDRRCCGCGEQKPLELHHTNYDCLGAEKPHHLVAVCRDCHKAIHDELNHRFPNFPMNRKVGETWRIWSSIFSGSMEAAKVKYGYIEAPKAKPLPKKKNPKAACSKCGDKSRRPFGSRCHCGGEIVARAVAAEMRRQKQIEMARKVREWRQAKSTAEYQKECERLGDEAWIRRLPTFADRVKARIELRKERA